MNYFTCLCCVVLCVSHVCAQENDKKWISIQPITLSQAGIEKNQSKPLNNKMPQNLQVIKNLLDHVAKHEISEQKSKNWYSFEASDK
jgi:hypothetical protein